MKKAILLAGTFCLLLFLSCRKDKSNPEAPLAKLKTSKQTMFSNVPYDYTSEFIYDEEGRVSEIKQFGMNTAIISKKYTYVLNQVYYRHYLTGVEQTSQAVDYTLNNAGLVQDLVSSSYNQKFVYEYNNQKYIKKVYYFRNGSPDGYLLYSYSNGNILDSISGYNNDNTRAYVSIYSYEPGKRNTIGNENKGLGMFGKDQQLPQKKETRVVYNFPGGPYGVRLKFFENVYEYTYSATGNIKTATIYRTDFTSTGAASQPYISAAYDYAYE
jgi:hypothetical protein